MVDADYHSYFETAFDAAVGRLPIGRDFPEWALPLDLRSQVLTELHHTVTAAGEELEGLGHSLRADARLFLLLVYAEMMVLPVIAVRGEEAEALLADVATDVNRLVRVAAENTQEREVSGRRVLDALSGEWRELELTRSARWESVPDW